MALNPNGKSPESMERKTMEAARGEVANSIVMKPETKSDDPVAPLKIKPHGKDHVNPLHGDGVMLFRDISLGPHESELRFRLVHFWEARNPTSKTLIGLEMVLIDEMGTAIQGFIPSGRVQTYLPHMTRGAVYILRNFYGSKSKTVYRVADHSVTVSFSWNSVLSALENCPLPFHNDQFRFHSYEEFEANCDLKGDLYDVVGHMKLVNGQTLTDRPVLDEVEIAATHRLLVHVQSKEGPVMKLYLWDQAAIDFCKKFKSHENPPTVLLVTTVNPKRFGGTLTLTTMSSSRVFMDNEVEPTIEYSKWLDSHPDIASLVNAEVVTKPETMTIGELLSYMKQESAKEAFFECTATIDDVVLGSPWYYIACSGCKTKATKGPTSLMCIKCGKVNVIGVAQYRAKISVYDNSDQAVFVLLGDAGRELTWKNASELVENYFEAHASHDVDQEVPVPEALIKAIGQTHKFSVKISDHNLTGKTRAITVTKILTSVTLPPETAGENSSGSTEAEALISANEQGLKRVVDIAEPSTAKRSKC